MFRLEHIVTMFQSEHIVIMFRSEHIVIMFRLEHCAKCSGWNIGGFGFDHNQ